MLHPLDLRDVTVGLLAALPRPEVDGDGPIQTVRDIIDQVRTDGDAALLALTQRFDHVEDPRLRVDPTEIDAALGRLAPAERSALQLAADQVRTFHEAQRHEAVTVTRGGAEIRSIPQPVDRAGLYVPGGRAVYPSTVLMTAMPAVAAGVADIALCVPPAASGAVADIVLAAAAVCGIDQVHPVGGAQAIAAMAFGTESIAAVDVITGPGNAFVAIAKREVAGVVGVPSAFAGPSEVVVVADASTDPVLAAIDVILQAEHGPGGLAWLIGWEQHVLDAVDAEVERLVARSPRSEDIMATLSDGGYATLVRDAEQAIDVVNAIAPEHLELLTADPDALVGRVRHAGAVFCGPWAPASVGDYVAGPSHVLPTNGTARFSGALTVSDFQKHMHVVTYDRPELERVGPAVIALAEAEGLQAHADSVRIRLDRPS